jgi:Holliday junction resolvase RusA-like endonuclease
MAEPKVLTLLVPGEPFAKQRPRVTKTGHAYTPQETANYENLVKVCFREKYPEHVPTDKPIAINIEAEYPIPKSWSKKKRSQALNKEIFPTRHDWDNVGKIICDALNGIAYQDDKQIFRGSVTKFYGYRTHVYVTMAVIGEEVPEEPDEELW